MDVTFKTLMGNIKLESLSPGLQMDELKQLLRSKAENAVPPPEQQRLVCGNRSSIRACCLMFHVVGSGFHWRYICSTA